MSREKGVSMEALVIGLALFLILGRGLGADGRTLLWLESVFLVDATFLGSELFASDLTLGSLVALGLVLLAGLKLGLIARGLGVAFDRSLGMAFVPVALVLAVPGVFAALAQAQHLSLPIVYLLWWVLAALIVGQGMIERGHPVAVTGGAAGEGAMALRQALGILPTASLGVHLVAAGWVQDVAFDLSLLGPVFLALGLRSLLRDRSSEAGKGSLAWPAAAILVSMSAPAPLVVASLGGVMVSPLRVTLLAAGLLYLLGLRIHRSFAFLCGAGLCLLAAGSGHSMTGIVTTWLTALRSVLSWPARLMPRTAGQWGALTVGLSFVRAYGVESRGRDPMRHWLCALVTQVAFLAAPLPTAAQSVVWTLIDVQTQIDNDGRVHVVETHHLQLREGRELKSPVSSDWGRIRRSCSAA